MRILAVDVHEDTTDAILLAFIDFENHVDFARLFLETRLGFDIGENVSLSAIVITHGIEIALHSPKVEELALAEELLKVEEPAVIEEAPKKKKPVVAVSKAKPKNDEFVDRLFLLKNVSAADKTLGDARRTVIPGAVSRLKDMISSMGLEDLHRDSSGRAATDESVSIIALASLNAIRIRDRASNMALYRDLIESIDSSLVTTPRKSLGEQFGENRDSSDQLWREVK